MSSSVTVDIFVSVDGWAGSDGLPGYFGYFGPELDEWITTELNKPQIVIMGRRTYAAMAAHAESWGPMDKLEKIVFSRTLTEVSSPPNTRICANDLVEEIRRMKAEGDTPLRTMGSISVARQLLDAGLVDRLRLMVFPLIAGPSGREPFFADMVSADLALVEHRALDDRVLILDYRPTGKDIPRG